jgi:dGTPase
MNSETTSPYAMRTLDSQGREFPENEHPFRNIYQRDRDRIIHSTAFRRLAHKTQVLVTQTNDHHRTRLTHTLEVAQISRTVARQLGLNEDLTEAIALSHDLGHPPFGHAGEYVLRDCMADHGGFEHNRHALRIVEYLEYPYADHPGLNLTWEVREAMALHSKTPESPEVKKYLRHNLPFFEAQVADTCDSLAYNAHDIDDAISLGIITLDDLSESKVWCVSLEKARKTLSTKATQAQIQLCAVRFLIDIHVHDLISNSKSNIAKINSTSLDAIRNSASHPVCHSNEVEGMKRELGKVLKEKIYNNWRVQRMANKGARFVNSLFAEFISNPSELPARYKNRIPLEGLHRTACDYIAGMTDRFAQEEYKKIFNPYFEV